MHVTCIYTLTTHPSSSSVPVSKLRNRVENTESSSQGALDPLPTPPLKWKEGNRVKPLQNRTPPPGQAAPLPLRKQAEGKGRK